MLLKTNPSTHRLGASDGSGKACEPRDVPRAQLGVEALDRRVDEGLGDVDGGAEGVRLHGEKQVRELAAGGLLPAREELEHPLCNVLLPVPDVLDRLREELQPLQGQLPSPLVRAYGRGVGRILRWQRPGLL
jgi:hypothetical protein